MQRRFLLVLLVACGAPARIPDENKNDTLQHAPSSPGVTATVSDKRVTLTWSAAGVNVGYQILRGTRDTAGETLIGTTNELTFIDDQALQNCTKYVYVVRAANPLGMADSSPVEATPTSDVSCWQMKQASPRWSDVASVLTVSLAVGDRNYLKRSTGGGFWNNAILPSADAFTTVTTMNGTFIAGTQGGAIFASSDGTHFTKRSENVPGSRMIAAGSKLVRLSGTTVFVSQNEGATWSSVPTTAPGDFVDVAYGNGAVVAAHASGFMVANVGGLGNPSDTGFTDAGSISGTVVSIAYGVGGGFTGWVAVTREGAIFRSDENGYNWTEVKRYPLNPLAGVAFGNGVFILVFVDGHYIPWNTMDSLPLSLASVSSLPATNEILGVRFADAQFHVLGAGDMILTTGNGVTWSQPSLGGSWNAIEVGQKTVITVGSSGKFARSVDTPAVPAGEQWTEGTIANNATVVLRGVAYGLNKWVACGESAQGSTSGAIYVSNNDGEAWTQASSGGDACATVRFLNGRFYAGMRHNAIRVWDGADLSPWVETFVGAPSENWRITDLAYGSGFMAVSNGNGVVYKSTDGISWTQAMGNLDPYFTSGASGLSFFSGAFLAYGISPGLARSSDGGLWQPIAAEYNFTRVRALNTKQIAVGGGEDVYVSSNGTTWTPDKLLVGARVRDFVQIGARLIGVGPDATYVRVPPTLK